MGLSRLPRRPTTSAPAWGAFFMRRQRRPRLCAMGGAGAFYGLAMAAAGAAVPVLRSGAHGTGRRQRLPRRGAAVAIASQ